MSNDLYLCGSEGESPEYRVSGGKRSIFDEGRRALREKHGVGAWTRFGNRAPLVLEATFAT